MNILASLQALADADYKKFHSGLIPTVPQEKILGVRTPALRQLAKKLHGTAEAESFLWSLPHVYYYTLRFEFAYELLFRYCVYK